MSRERKTGPFVEILNRLADDLEALEEKSSSNKTSVAVRRRLDTQLRELIVQANTLLSNLDPVHQPRFVFDPGDPTVVARFIGLAMIAQPRVPLPDIKPFYGSGIYALYYKGDFHAYKPVSGTETPVYVGKADPKSDTAKTPIEQGVRLFNRLKDHRRSIGKAKDTLNTSDFDYRSLVIQSGWQVAAEDYLINLFRPAWNNETGICYGLGKHGDSPSTRANLRSPWDTLHSGRDWAWRDPKMGDARARPQIIADLEVHYSTRVIYRDVNQILKDFVDELAQL